MAAVARRWPSRHSLCVCLSPHHLSPLTTPLSLPPRTRRMRLLKYWGFQRCAVSAAGAACPGAAHGPARYVSSRALTMCTACVSCAWWVDLLGRRLRVDDASSAAHVRGSCRYRYIWGAGHMKYFFRVKTTGRRQRRLSVLHTGMQNGLGTRHFEFLCFLLGIARRIRAAAQEMLADKRV